MQVNKISLDLTFSNTVDGSVTPVISSGTGLSSTDMVRNLSVIWLGICLTESVFQASKLIFSHDVSGRMSCSLTHKENNWSILMGGFPWLIETQDITQKSYWGFLTKVARIFTVIE